MIARGAAGSAGEIRERAAAAGVPVAFVDRRELDILAAGGKHQGVAAVLAAGDRASLADLLRDDSGVAQPPIILAADQVQDVGNLGSLIRTLEAVGGAGAVIPGRRSAGPTSGLARASAGASLRTPIVVVPNLARALQDLKARGVWVIGLDAAAPTEYDTLDYTAPCCLVVGNEARGLRRLVRQMCDQIVRVPMRGGVGSLNVAVAGGIVLYHVARSRSGGSSGDW